MFDRTNGIMFRSAYLLNPQASCPIAAGKVGLWQDATDNAWKLRNADLTDTVVGEGGGVAFAARLFAVAALPTCVYANGTAGVGATLTKSTNGALGTIDGVTVAVGDLIVVGGQASTFQNGLYVATAIGASGAKWVLTRANDLNQSAEFIAGALFAISAGTTYAGAVLKYTGATGPVVGTDAITFAVQSTPAAAAEQISASGALSNIIHTSILAVSGTKAYTLANGTRVGQRKTIFCRSAASTPVGVVTPASPNNFATLTFSTANGMAELEWNGTGWDLVGAVTVTVA